MSLFSSQILLGTGISTGDEGKGRLIPELVAEITAHTGRPDAVAAVIKVNGGANSGHTVAGLKLNLIPAGIVCPEVDKMVIGAGVVADPLKFLWEGAYINHKGHSTAGRLLIDERAMVSDVSHRMLDLAWEYYRVHTLGEEARGSTGRGISPAYMDETAHFPLFYSAFQRGKDAFAQAIQARLSRAQQMIHCICRVDEEAFAGFFQTLTDAEAQANHVTIAAGKLQPDDVDFTVFRGDKPFTFNAEAVIALYWEAGLALRETIGNAREFLYDALAQGKFIIGEFGQAYWLDKRHGFAPNVTASHSTPPEFFQSAGLPLQPVQTFGVCKAYDTKVGTHTFICEMPEGHPLKTKLMQIEFGVSTGRQRMVGWFDAVEKGDAIRYGGCNDLMVNKVDLLTYDPEAGWDATRTGPGDADTPAGALLIGVGYETADGEVLRHVPREAAVHPTLKPVYKSVPGWAEDLSPIRTFDNLPLNAKRYLATAVNETLKVAFGEDRQSWPSDLPRLRYIGVGPDPSEIIKDAPPTWELVKLAV